MSTTTIELTDVQTEAIAAVIRAEQSVERAQTTARERWTDVMTDEAGELTDDQTNRALCTAYCDKRVASAKRGDEYKTSEDRDAYVAEVVRKSKNVWKNRRKEVKAALSGAGNRMATADRKTDKGADERRAEARAAIRRALGAGVDLADIIADAEAEAAKLAK